MPFLIHSSKADALARSDQAGEDKGLAYHAHGKEDGTRYVWAIIEEGGETARAALKVSQDVELLTAEEQAALVEQLPADWSHPTDDNA